MSASSGQTGLVDRMVARAVPLVPRPLVRRLARPYVSGLHLDDALRVVSDLHAEGLRATVDILGEHVTDERTATAAADGYIRTLDALAGLRTDAHVSLKPTALGSLLDWELAGRQVERVVTHAESIGGFVCIDMEDATTTDATLALYRRLRAAGHQRVGTVVQARLWRTAEDVAGLAPLRPSIRICKGIYLEPPQTAMQDRDAIRLSFGRVLRSLLAAGSFVAVATHDEQLVVDALDAVSTLGIGRDGYEFQTLLGVRPDLARVLARSHAVRVYVPYGPDSYAYAQRRLRENPQVAGYVARDLARELARGLHLVR